MNCEICNIREAKIKHHLTYKPEKIMLVCSKCHRIIHSNNSLLNDFKPSKEQMNFIGSVCIKLEKETRTRLNEFGKKGQTYDEVLNNLMNEYEEVRK